MTQEITNAQVKASAIVFLDAFRQEFVKANPGVAPATQRLEHYDLKAQAIVLRATKRMLMAYVASSAPPEPPKTAHTSFTDEPRAEAPKTAHHRFRAEGDAA